MAGSRVVCLPGDQVLAEVGELMVSSIRRLVLHLANENPSRGIDASAVGSRFRPFDPWQPHSAAGSAQQVVEPEPATRVAVLGDVCAPQPRECVVAGGCR